MKIQHLESLLGCRILVRGEGYPDAEFTSVVATDLMSDVLMVDTDNMLIVTSLTSEQVIRTADLVGARAVLLVNGKAPMPAMRKIAEENGLSVLSTSLSCFHACVELGKHLETGNGS